ncbi:MBL fold hydrolase [Halobacteriales archaeon SW_12_71_31]|nr:MAG: MBL fold hydrolase [Halobacteriales archaeon SW_12_71_31]
MDRAVTRVSVPTETRTPAGTTNCYLVGDTVIDPAGAAETVDAAAPDHVLVTHTHADHVGGVAAYADDAVVWARDGHAERFREATGVDPDRTFADGDRLPTDPPLTVLDAPGHAPDHVVFRLAGNDRGDSADAATGDPRPALFVGDVAVAEGSVVVGAPDGDMREYLATLARLRDLDPPPARLYPGHGPAVDEPRATFDRLIEHRLERERRVLSAVRAGVETVPAITDAAYDRDLAGVRDLATATVRAHVEKLAHEGRLRWDGDRARSL